MKSKGWGFAHHVSHRAPALLNGIVPVVQTPTFPKDFIRIIGDVAGCPNFRVVRFQKLVYANAIPDLKGCFFKKTDGRHDPKFRPRQNPPALPVRS